MIISTVLTVVCFVVIIFELLSILSVLKSCRKVSCRVESSKKVCEREDGFLIKEYYKTEISFELDGTSRCAEIETSTFCQNGQVLSCYYYPKKNIVFRKRDIKNVLNTYSIQAFSIGITFLLLNLLFHVTSIGGLILEHTFEAAAVLMLITFTLFGCGFIIYSVNAFRHTRHSRVTEVKAEITDVVRRSKRHKENIRYIYYPIYRYKLNGTEHTVRSKTRYDLPPDKRKHVTLLVDTKKGSLVEYKDMDTSFMLGICFLIIAVLLFYSVAFM